MSLYAYAYANFIKQHAVNFHSTKISNSATGVAVL